MRRAGYDVRLAWDLVAGSYEQCPVSLASSASRDRRWCQGNLQHLRIMLSPAFTLALHRLSSPEPLHGPLAVATLALMLVTLGLLFSGKMMALALVLLDARRLKEHGGPLRLFTSAVVEMVVAALSAPILMVSHALCVASVLFGFSVDWAAANRDETVSPWTDALRAHGFEGLVGAAIAMSSLIWAPSVLLWLMPIWFSLLLAVPLGALLSSRATGERLRAHGLLLSPPEVQTPVVMQRAARLMTENEANAGTFLERFERMIQDPWLNLLHVSLLESTGVRLRPRRVIESLVVRVAEEGPVVLDRKETLAVLSDAWAMRALHEQSLQRTAEARASSEPPPALPGRLHRAPPELASRPGAG
jgi:membrane glycosyltransferase